mmetsp:Transcript_323/g.460  ORF Transcript_323/g.460 Transcript_323/m.460 type:complete len:88 (+) Transcript_323:781-1044(+)
MGRRIANPEGNPAWNVEQKINCLLSKDSKLCRSVVPVRGCPKTKTGLGFTIALAILPAKITQSRKPKKVLMKAINVRKIIRSQYLPH